MGRTGDDAMAQENWYTAPGADPGAGGRGTYAVRYPVLRWALGGAGGGGFLGSALVVYVVFSPPPPGADDGIGPMTAAVLPWLAVAFVAALATAGFVAGLFLGLVVSALALFEGPRGPRRPMGG